MRRLSLISLVVAPLLGCPGPRPLANDPDLDPGEPAGRAPVFVEREPDKESGHLPKALSPEVAGLYRCWFRDPYDYMFTYTGGATFDIHGRSYGMLSAGISGLLFYGGLSPCAAEQIGAEQRGWGDDAALGQFAGVPTRNPQSSISQFTPVNPEFVVWARKTLLADPEALIDGHRVQEAYDLVFQRFFRLMVLSAVMLVERTGSLDAMAGEAKQYIVDTDAGAYGVEWLEQHYYGLVPAYPEMQDGTTLTAGMAAGFWLRRQVDGSLPACWAGALEVAELYDRFWLAEQRGAHAQGFASLDALVPSALD